MMEFRNRYFQIRPFLIFFAVQFVLGASGAQAFSGAALSPHGIIHCRQKQGTQSDTANVALGFAGGTLTNMTWDGTKLVLSAGQTSGNFISRIFDSSNCHGITPWLNFSWTSTLPFGKELPATSESTTDYSGLNANLMTGLRALWHLNEASYNGTANEVVDSSGNGHHGSYATASVTNSTGLFNRGVAPNSADIHVTNLPSMAEIFSYQVWIKTTDPTDWAIVTARHDASNNGWQIQLDETGVPYIRIDTSAGLNQSDCYHSTSVIDGKWHQLVILINNGTCAIFVDGVKDSGTYLRGAGFSGAGLLYLDSMLVGQYDEVAFWDRTLTDAEVLGLYRRGANRVKVQLRTCVNANCSDEPTWKGTDATTSTFFTELNNNSNQATGFGTVQSGAINLLLSNFPSVIRDYRYFQYKIILETDNTTYSPDVKSVGVTK